MEIDGALRAQMERVVRQYELGSRLVPCFFGMQQRYQPDTNYLAFLEKTDEGWNTVRQYELSGDHVDLGRPGVLLSPQHRPLVVGEETYSAVFSAFDASETQPNTGEYGQLWVIQEQQVPLAVVKKAIAQLKGSSVTPPTTGSAGLR